MTAATTAVLVAERNPIVATAVSGAVEGLSGFHLAGRCSNAAEYYDALRRSAVEIVLFGWNFEDEGGGRVLTRTRAEWPDVRVAVFTGDSDPFILKQAIRLGAHGYAHHSEEERALELLLAEVHRGRISIPWINMRHLDDSPLSTLTRRERELLEQLAQGWTNQQIATRTGISENTVKYHLKNLYDKLDVRNRAMAVALFSAERRLHV